MNILTVENISKGYGEKTLLSDITFTITDEDKIGVIGINGTGKTTLLRIIAGCEAADTGSVSIPNSMKIEYLPQNPDFDPEATVLEQVFRGESSVIKLIRDYEKALNEISKNPEDENLQRNFMQLTSAMDTMDAWEFESLVKTILTKLGITSFDERMGNLSGGQKKRVALSGALITPCDLLILDEPTNHLDNDTIDWLEKHLETRKGALLMITHDRYFLDRVVNKTMELDGGSIYTYTGGYSEFIEKKAERKSLESAIERKRQNLYRNELEWMRRGAKARTTKQKARIQRFDQLEDAKLDIDDSKIELSAAHSRLGKKIIEINSISKSFGDNKLIDGFSYIVLRDDRIGIVGSNGLGKSTLLNLIAGRLELDSGSIDIGPTVKIGYFSQESEDMDTSLRAIEYIRSYAEFVTTADGTKLSASQMMERFLFTGDMQWTYISRLSGGEKRRLYLLRILMDAPNVLILDEPTNDLDIETLRVLEGYIDEFGGAVITVSHDRYFLDRVCNKIFSFEGGEVIEEYVGNYSDFAEKRQQEQTDTVAVQKNQAKEDTERQPARQKTKLSYKEQLEYEGIGAEIEALEELLEKLERDIASNSSDFSKLQEIMDKKEQTEEELLYKLERQEYLENLKASLEA